MYDDGNYHMKEYFVMVKRKPKLISLTTPGFIYKQMQGNIADCRLVDIIMKRIFKTY